MNCDTCELRIVQPDMFDTTKSKTVGCTKVCYKKWSDPYLRQNNCPIEAILNIVEYVANSQKKLPRYKPVKAKKPKQPKKCYATYHGEGGYDDQIKRADKIFVKGKRYQVVGGSIHSSYSDIVLKDIAGRWNSCLFDVDIFKAPLLHDYV